MSNRIVLFIDDFTCCASSPTDPSPEVALSSQILLGPKNWAPFAVVCPVKSEPDQIRDRLKKELNRDCELIGLKEALKVSESSNLERYLAVLLAACLRESNGHQPVEELVVAIPLRNDNDRKRCEEALEKVSPPLKIKNCYLADAHRLAAQNYEESFNNDREIGRRSAVIALWREGISVHFFNGIDSTNIRHDAYDNINYLPIKAEQLHVAAPDLRTLVARTLKKTTEECLGKQNSIKIDRELYLIAPQIPNNTSKDYGFPDDAIGKINEFIDEITLKDHPQQKLKTTPQLLSEQATGNSLQVRSFVFIGGLATHPAIRAGLAGDQTKGLTFILRNQWDGTTELLDPICPIQSVTSILKAGLALSFEGGPTPTWTKCKVALPQRIIKIGDQTCNALSDIVTITSTSKADRANDKIPIELSRDSKVEKVEKVELLLKMQPYDKGYNPVLEFKHQSDSSLNLMARLNDRFLPLETSLPTEQGDGPCLDLQDNGSYRLTINKSHRDQCQLNKDLVCLVSSGLHIYGSDIGDSG